MMFTLGISNNFAAELWNSLPGDLPAAFDDLDLELHLWSSDQSIRASVFQYFVVCALEQRSSRWLARISQA